MSAYFPEANSNLYYVDKVVGKLSENNSPAQIAFERDSNLISFPAERRILWYGLNALFVIRDIVSELSHVFVICHVGTEVQKLRRPYISQLGTFSLNFTYLEVSEPR